MCCGTQSIVASKILDQFKKHIPDFLECSLYWVLAGRIILIIELNAELPFRCFRTSKLKITRVTGSINNTKQPIQPAELPFCLPALCVS